MVKLVQLILKIAIILALLIPLASLVDTSRLLTPTSSYVYLLMRNEAADSVNASFFFYPTLGLFNITESSIVFINGDFRIDKIEDGSGVEVWFSNLAPGSDIAFRIDNMGISPLMKNGLRDIRVNIDFHENVSENDLGYEVIISLWNEHKISIASRHIYTVRYDPNNRLPRYDDRNVTSNHILVLMGVAVVLCAFILSTIQEWNKAKWFPFTSVFLIWLTLALYIFIGSGYEVNARKHVWIAPLSVFTHGYDSHINWNLFYFVILSVLGELFIRISGKNFTKDMIYYYVIPLFSPMAWSIVTKVWGFGLSFSIEIMTWTLWLFLIYGQAEIPKTRLTTMMLILSGIPSMLFFDWTTAFLFGSFTGRPYENFQAIRHITFGIISGIILLICWFLSYSLSKVNKARLKSENESAKP